jgi:hypothetical protein
MTKNYCKKNKCAINFFVSFLQSLVSFVSKHLNKVNLDISYLESQFHDGVYLVLLMGLLEGYFVPLFEFHLTPKDFEQKVFNVAYAFELMQDAGLSKPKARPEGKEVIFLLRNVSLIILHCTQILSIWTSNQR